MPAPSATAHCDGDEDFTSEIVTVPLPRNGSRLSRSLSFSISSAMAAIDVHVRRFGDDDEFGFQLLDVEQVLPAKSVAILLHDRGGEQNRELVVQAKFLDDAARVNHRGHAAFLIHRAATPDLSGLHERLEWIKLPLRQIAGINRVHVAVERDHAFALADAAAD